MLPPGKKTTKRQAKHRLACTHTDQDRPVSRKLSKIPSGELPEEAGDKAAAVKAPSRKSFGDVTRSARRLLPVSFRQRPLQQQQQPADQPNLPTHHAKPTGNHATTSLDTCFKFLICFSTVQQMANLVCLKHYFLMSRATTACPCMTFCHAKSSLPDSADACMWQCRSCPSSYFDSNMAALHVHAVQTCSHHHCICKPLPSLVPPSASLLRLAQMLLLHADIKTRECTHGSW